MVDIVNANRRFKKGLHKAKISVYKMKRVSSFQLNEITNAAYYYNKTYWHSLPHPNPILVLVLTNRYWLIEENKDSTTIFFSFFYRYRRI